jgi:hypothetical protein
VRAAVIIATAGLPVRVKVAKDMRSMEKLAIPLTPTARPSSPSIRLTALVMPIIQRIVTGIASTPIFIKPPSEKGLGFVKISARSPHETGIAAAASCPPSLTHHFKPITSSIAPTTTSTTPPARMPATVRSSSFVPNTRKDTINPVKIASPPKRGMG